MAENENLISKDSQVWIFFFLGGEQVKSMSVSEGEKPLAVKKRKW